MAIKAKVRIIDKGKRKRRKFVAEIGKYKKAFVEIGLFEDAKNEQSAKPQSISQYGHNHEFGITLPKRPFMRPAFDNNNKKYSRILSKGQAGIIKGSTRVKKVLFNLGRVAHNDIKKQIITGTYKPLKEGPYADKKKAVGKNKILINTGSMRNAITWQTNIKKKVTKGKRP